MKWRLDEDHYDSDAMLTLPTGTVVGDGCENPWRYPETSANKSLRGKPRPPSRSMTPIDDEAKKMWKEKFPEEELPDRDPTASIPLTTIARDNAGNIKTSTPSVAGQMPSSAPTLTSGKK